MNLCRYTTFFSNQKKVATFSNLFVHYIIENMVEWMEFIVCAVIFSLWVYNIFKLLKYLNWFFDSLRLLMKKNDWANRHSNNISIKLHKTITICRYLEK